MKYMMDNSQSINFLSGEGRGKITRHGKVERDLFQPIRSRVQSPVMPHPVLP